jgi:hypothetical protein
MEKNITSVLQDNIETGKKLNCRIKLLINKDDYGEEKKVLLDP